MVPRRYPTSFGGGPGKKGCKRSTSSAAYPTAPATTKVQGNGSEARTRQGSPWLRKLLVEAAHAAAHTKQTYLWALYHRLKARLGAKKAMMAVGHAIVVICSHLLDQQVSSEELGGNYVDERDRQATEKRLVQRLEKLGYEVSLQPAAQIA